MGKIIVQFEPDEVELVLNELEKADFIIDQETYCYFRDEVFIKDIEKYIKKVAPGKWQETKNAEGADKVTKWYDNQDLINKYYPKYNKRRETFYLYKGAVYFWNYIGFINVGNEIQIIKIDMQDIVNLLNGLNVGKQKFIM